VLPDKIVYLTKKIKQYIAIANNNFFKNGTFSLNSAIHYLMQVMYQLRSKNTIPSKHAHIQPFRLNCTKMLMLNCTKMLIKTRLSVSFIEAKSSMISSK